jgi:hypothetical protein
MSSRFGNIPTRVAAGIIAVFIVLVVGMGIGASFKRGETLTTPKVSQEERDANQVQSYFADLDAKGYNFKGGPLTDVTAQRINGCPGDERGYAFQSGQYMGELCVGSKIRFRTVYRRSYMEETELQALSVK